MHEAENPSAAGARLRDERGDLSRVAYAKVGFEVQGAAFEVYRALGPGFLEAVYERAMLVELTMRGLHVPRQVAVPVRYKDQFVGRYFADLVVEHVAVVELKAQPELSAMAVPQVLNYLKASGLPLGFLINFSPPRATIRRFLGPAAAAAGR